MKIRRHFFSLLELIIVMGILAVLASLLLENFADVKARECEEQTYEKGSHVRAMIKGRPSDEGIGAFLSDMGRFPSLYIPPAADGGDGNGGRRLAELYDPGIWYCNSGTGATALQRERSISASAIQTILRGVEGSTFPASGLYYPEVSMSIGWNGPYINISSPVKGNYFDGWGNPWKIISNYSYKVSGSRLEESDTVKVYASSAEIDALRDTTANKRYRIDGIASYGADDAADSSGTAAAADRDQRFLFPHNMDNHSSENMASLTVTLKIRDEKTGQWVTLPAISSWQSDTSYAKGALAAYEGALYCALELHTSGSTFESSRWAALSTAVAYTPGSMGPLCIYNNTYYLRNNGNTETEFTPANWLRIAGVREIPENVSLLLFTPVMQGSYDERRMELGYYHFYRNRRRENAHGVQALAVSGTPDIDCEGDTSTVYTAADSSNARYLIAEDHSNSSWNTFSIKRLIPGRRKIFCMTYNSVTQSCFQTQAETVALRRGNNHITLYLEQK